MKLFPLEDFQRSLFSAIHAGQTCVFKGVLRTQGVPIFREKATHMHYMNSLIDDWILPNPQKTSLYCCQQFKNQPWKKRRGEGSSLERTERRKDRKKRKSASSVFWPPAPFGTFGRHRSGFSYPFLWPAENQRVSLLEILSLGRA